MIDHKLHWFPRKIDDDHRILRRHLEMVHHILQSLHIHAMEEDSYHIPEAEHSLFYLEIETSPLLREEEELPDLDHNNHHH